MTSFLLEVGVPFQAPAKLNVSIGREQNTHVNHNKIMSLMLNAVRRSAPLGPTVDIAIDPN
jgi:hypothetical protein